MSSEQQPKAEDVQAPLAQMPVAQTPTILPTSYAEFLLEVKTQVRQRQLQALRAVNSELLALYWWLGENISQRQAKFGECRC